MKKAFLSILLVSIIGFISSAQLITTTPTFSTRFDQITLFFDASLSTGEGGNDASSLEGYVGSDVYAHTGVTIEGEGTWQYVNSTWGTADSAKFKLERVSGDLWKLVIGDPYAYYYVPSAKKITQLSFVFRNTDGSRSGRAPGGADIFLDLYEPGVTAEFTQPFLENPYDNAWNQPYITPSNQILDIQAIGVGIGTTIEKIELFINESLTETVYDDTLNYTFNSGTDYGQTILKVVAHEDGTLTDTAWLPVYVMTPVVNENRPAGTRDGVNILNDNSAVFSLNAPNKSFVYLMGDFNEWEVDNLYQMKHDSIDELHEYWWIEANGLSPSSEYGFQYLVDGVIRIPDPYTEKILDPWNDQSISSITYPGLKPYPQGKTEDAVSTFKTVEAEYQWQTAEYVRPAKEELIIYELLIRDFLARHDYKTLTDTLNYLAKLGINAVELMPVNEFEGNNSWGYNPSFHFALDKYYGPKNSFKAFIDSCHARGMAVILDVVLNHVFGQNSLVRLYNSGKYSAPTSENPWLNTEATHPFNVGYDFNHESLLTQVYVDSVNRYWMQEYKVDGYRFDLSKGFMQTGSFYDYNASRIALLKRMADQIWVVDPDFYVILEHLGENTEEKELADYGMMLWGKMTDPYNEATMGYHDSNKSDLTWGYFQSRGWTNANLVTYMESHDEERLMYKNLEYGNLEGDYSVKNLTTALERMELAAAFFFTIPGSKMIWQFGELGYNYSKYYDIITGVVYPGNDLVKVSPKPIRWDYLNDARRKHLYETFSILINLRKNQEVFYNPASAINLAVQAAEKRITLEHGGMYVSVIGNFGVAASSINPSFNATGYWYDYFSGDSIDVTDTQAAIPLEPGEFHIYTNQRLEKPVYTAIIDNIQQSFQTTEVTVYPNPAYGPVRIRIDTDRMQHVSIRVFDIAGKLIANIAEDIPIYGKQLFEWDGTSGSGESAHGIYFIQVSTPESIRTVKVIRF